MKRLLACLLVAGITVSLAACNPKDIVQDAVRDALSGNSAEYTMRVGESDDWTPFYGASGVTFANSNNNAVSIADDGETVTFTGLAVGVSTITASYDGKENKATVNVVADFVSNPSSSEPGGESSIPSESGSDSPGTSGEGGYIGERPESGHGSSIVTPARIPDFAIEYKYTPPTDMYIIIWEQQEFPKPDAPGQAIRHFVAKIEEAYSYSWVYDKNTTPIEYAETRINFATGQGSTRFLGASDWQEDDYDYSEHKDLISVGIFSAFEDYFVHYLRNAMGGDLGKLAEYYIGNEVLTIGTKREDFDCWVFDTQGFNDVWMRFWIDPADSCCMMYENYNYTCADGSIGSMVETIADYDLAYIDWTTESW